MGIPHRGKTGHGTYFITASTFQKKQILQATRIADLFLRILTHYQGKGKFLLHEYVIMPDHIHLLITPVETLERSIQLIKGGFSFRAKKELGFGGEVWQNSYYDRRVRDPVEYAQFRQYIHSNPVKRGLAAAPDQYIYSSADKSDHLDAVPPGLKP